MTPRMELLALHLHSLGPRAVAELLQEIARAHDIEADILDRMERYRAIDRATLVELGVHGFPAQPLRRVA